MNSQTNMGTAVVVVDRSRFAPAVARTAVRVEAVDVSGVDAAVDAAIAAAIAADTVAVGTGKDALHRLCCLFESVTILLSKPALYCKAFASYISHVCC